MKAGKVPHANAMSRRLQVQLTKPIEWDAYEGRKSSTCKCHGPSSPSSTNEADEIEATNVLIEVNFATCKAISKNELKAKYLTYPLNQTMIKHIRSGKRSD